jgi:lysozyme family protein
MPVLSRLTDFDDLRDEYAAFWATMKVNEGVDADSEASFAVSHQVTYAQAGDPLGVPWWWIAIVHRMEADGNFHCHLHNGDPLTARTVHVPAGRPLTGSPPFTWVASAQDALTLEGFANQDDWSLPVSLWRLERYNGMGYRRMGYATPYLWSGSNYYVAGKFTSDGHYDPTDVSKEIGAAVILRALIDSNAVAAP